MEYMHLVGAENIPHAASQMQQAAETMRQAAETVRFALEQHQQFMGEWLEQYKACHAQEAQK